LRQVFGIMRTNQARQISVYLRAKGLMDCLKLQFVVAHTILF